MRKQFFLRLMWPVLTCLLSGCLENEKVINRPRFSVRNNILLEIDKIILNDTATIIWFDVFEPFPDGIRIDSTACITAGGKRYNVTNAMGIELNQVYPLPDEKSFALIFPPIDRKTAVIDFNEENEYNFFDIFGIELRKGVVKRAVEQIPQEVRALDYSNDGLPDPILKYGKCQVTVHLVGYRQGLFKKDFTGFQRRFWVPGATYFDAPIDSAGIIRVEYCSYGPELMGFSENPYYGNVYYYLDGTGDTEIWIDLEEFSNRFARYQNPSGEEHKMIYSKSAYTAFNNIINKNKNSEFRYSIMEWSSLFYRKIVAMDGNSYLDYIQKQYLRAKENIETDERLSALEKKRHTINLTNEYMKCVILAEDILLEAHRIVYDADKSKVFQNFLKVDDSRKKEALKMVDLNNPKLLYAREFSSFILECHQKHPDLLDEITDPFLHDFLQGTPLLIRALRGESLLQEEIAKLKKLKEPFYLESILALQN